MSGSPGALPDSVAATRAALAGAGYVAGPALSTAVHLALHLPQPLLLEGEPGTGKTEIAKALARALDRPLIRLQCHEGMDLAQAAYDWNHARQLLHLKLREAAGGIAAAEMADLEASLVGPDYLLERPLLKALRLARDGAAPPVLLIDELDRADPPFEAFLLEFLGEWQISIPELGTLATPVPPIAILTSNRTREVHDALRRRCLYHWIDWPSAEIERQILTLKLPEAPAALTAAVVAFVQSLREMDLFKTPGIAESIAWARALLALDQVTLDPEAVADTMGTLLKYQDDIARVMASPLMRGLGAPATALRA